MLSEYNVIYNILKIDAGSRYMHNPVMFLAYNPEPKIEPKSDKKHPELKNSK